MQVATQTMTADQIRAAVDAFLLAARVSFTTSGGERHQKEAQSKDDKPWDCYAWRVTFTRQTPPAHITFDYYCGLAHATKPKHEAPAWQTTKAIPPTAADVLYSLVSDATAADQSFVDWCADLGFDEDSRRAERIYFECQDIARKLRVVFSRSQVVELAELVREL